MNRFAKYAWFVLFYNIAVIVWGAFVRASKSGAGCGDHWPDCNGTIMPQAPTIKTIIEFTHRSTSGLAGIFVVGLLIWAFIQFPKKHIVRKTALIAVGFIAVEGALGALLVKQGLVNEDKSIARAVVISIHLVNTMLLLGFLALTAWWGTTWKEIGNPLQFRGNYRSAIILILCLGGVIALSAIGAISALGATLFPVTSFSEAFARDLSPRHFLEGLIWIHPVAAVFFGLLMTFGVSLIGFSQRNPAVLKLTKLQIALLIAQLSIGGINVLLHAPVWLQLMHLLLADLVWVNLVFFTAAILQTLPAAKVVSKVENKELVIATN